MVRLFVNKYPEYHIINLDKLTYAGNLANLKDIEDKPNYEFVKMDICDFDAFLKLMQDKKVDGIIHLAAESHVDRSIKDPFTFAQTNVMGTLSLLQAAKAYWESLPEKYEGKRFYHISTDEVYGALEMTHPEGIEPPFTTKASSGEHHLAYGEKFFTEDLKYQPHSPYSAAKASSDHFVRAFHDTFGMPTIVTNCSNNYVPYQFPEKLIPLFINNIRHRKPLPVYGKGENVRDWLYVVDHARAIDVIFHQGKIAETYNIGGFNEWKNIDIIKVVIRGTLLEATRQLRKMSQMERYKRRHDLLRTIPGIGPIVSMCILTEVCDVKRFHNENEFAAYLGLVPTSHSSGEKTVHGEKTFRGNKQLGPMVVEAAWVAISWDAGLGSQYFQYKKRMEPQEAIVRIARKLSNIIFSVLKNEKEYVPYQTGN